MERCKNCPLKFRRPVEGTGPMDAKIFIIGEAPGKDEDRQGICFVGKSGQDLDTALKECGLRRDEVRINNVVKCFPTTSNPGKEIIDLCRSALEEELTKVSPTVVVPLGNIALYHVEGTMSGITNRAAIPKWMGSYWSIPNPHPAFYLRRGGRGKEKLVETLNLAKKFAYEASYPAPRYTLINNLALLYEWRQMLRDKNITRMSPDIETRDLDYDTDLLGIAFSHREYAAVYIPLKVSSFVSRRVAKQTGKSKKAKPIKQVNLTNFWGQNHQEVMDVISDVLTCGDYKFATQNGTFDLLHLRKEGGKALDFSDNWAFDTYGADHLLDENKRMGERGLATLTAKYIDLAGYKAKTQWAVDFASDLSLEQLADRAMRDADGTLREANRMSKEIVNQGLDFMMWDWTIPVLKLLTEMELNGVFIDRDYADKFNANLTKEIVELDKKIQSSAGLSFNPGSGDQVADVLFNRLKVGRPIKMTKTGERASTDKDHLIRFQGKHPIVTLLLKRADLDKTRSTYAEGYPKHIKKDGRVHTNWNIAGAVTGRLSSIRPNMQNPDKRVKVRRMVIAPAGWGILDGDESQAEMRWLTHYCQDPGLIRAYDEDKDIHSYNIARCFRMSYDDVISAREEGDKDIERKRDGIKNTVSFGVIYGMGDEALAASIQEEGESFKSALSRAKNLRKIYTEEFSRVTEYKMEVYAELEKAGELRNVYGRTRRLPTVFSPVQDEKTHAQRQGFNFIMQSSSSDMTLQYMCWIWEALKQAELTEVAKIFLNVHDSVMLRVKYEYMLDVVDIVLKATAPPPHPDVKVPMKLDISLYEAWKVPLIYHLQDGSSTLCGVPLPVADGHFVISNPDSRVPKVNWCLDCMSKL